MEPNERSWGQSAGEKTFLMGAKVSLAAECRLPLGGNSFSIARNGLLPETILPLSSLQRKLFLIKNDKGV